MSEMNKSLNTLVGAGLIGILLTALSGCASANFGNVSTEISCESRIPGLFSVELNFDQDLHNPNLFDKEAMLCGFKVKHKHMPNGLFGMKRLSRQMSYDRTYTIDGKAINVKLKTFGDHEIIDLDGERLTVHIVCKSIDFSSVEDILDYLQETAKLSEFVFDEDSASVVQIIKLRDRKAFDVSLVNIGRSTGYLGVYLSRIYLKGMPIPPGVLRHEVSSRQFGHTKLAEKLSVN